MGSARTGAILAVLRPVLAGLLLMLLLFAGPGALNRVAAAPVPGSAESATGPAAGTEAAATSPRTFRRGDPTGPEEPAIAAVPQATGIRGRSAAAVPPTAPPLLQSAVAPFSDGGGLPGQLPESAAAAAAPGPPASPLQRRLQLWPAWRLPAPLARPGRGAPVWPDWFSGDWLVESTVLPPVPGQPLRHDPTWCARFRSDGHGGAVADRAFNALSAGRSLLGETLLSVQDDPGNPQRQLARLVDDQLLETSLIGQRGERPDPDSFLNDELSLQVLHTGGEPRVSRIETLGRWRRLADGRIDGEQWQSRYASPSAGLAAAAEASGHWRIRLVPAPPESDRATGTASAAAGCR